MEVYRNYYSDQHLDMWSFMLNELGGECSSTSDNGSVSNCLSSFSDEEFLLASNNPKKRAGRKKFRETRHPIYRGVRRRNSGKWVCEMREPNKKTRIWLGTFPTPEMAARAHDVAAIALRGRYACLNFADSAWRLPIPASGETKDIQKAAAEAAAAEAAGAFRPSMEVDQVVYNEDVNVKEEEEVISKEETVLFMDEDEIFSMPWLITSMAEGLMLPPPVHSLDDQDQEHHLQLWSY